MVSIRSGRRYLVQLFQPQRILRCDLRSALRLAANTQRWRLHRDEHQRKTGADASLRNAGQTAVAWHGHFSGDHQAYDNAQHPYLIWSLYRIYAAGRIKQIGAAGAKHVFYSINKYCGFPAGNVFWPGYEDLYSFSSNDNGGGEQNLAPRSEIIAYTAQ